MHEDSAPDRSHTSLTQSVLVIRGREGFFVKKTIIALAAASSVALSHGVAVAEEGNTAQPSVEQGAFSSVDSKKENQAPEKDTEDKKDEQDKDEDKKATGSSINDFFGWDETTSGWTKFQNIAAAIAGVVALVGSISALFANIEKIVKQFTK